MATETTNNLIRIAGQIVLGLFVVAAIVALIAFSFIMFSVCTALSVFSAFIAGMLILFFCARF